jgi:hypothetical protein
MEQDWDLEQVYDNEIAPLITQIIAVCKEHKMPMAARFRYSSDMSCSTSLNFDKERGAEPGMTRVHAAVCTRQSAPFMTAIITTTPADAARKDGE